jgi:hypothetical protein
VATIGPDDSMDVDNTASLVLHHSTERKCNELFRLRLCPPENLGQMANEVDGRAPP